jgi:hypothetical protein
MDTQTLQTGGLSAGFIFGAALLYKLYHVINHHRIRGRCCGRVWDASIDIDGTTPPLPAPPQETTNPLHTIKVPETT